jgi:hypothetical protein
MTVDPARPAMLTNGRSSIRKGFSMRFSRLYVPVLTLATIAMAACQDGPVYPDLPPGTVLPGSDPAAALDIGRYTCLTSTAALAGPWPYRYGRMELRFPREALHPRQATHHYRYQAVDARGQVVRFVNCTIPRTDAAVAMMNRLLSVRSHTRSPLQRDMRPSGCVTEGPCILEPIVADGCDPSLGYDASCDDGGGEPCMTAVFEPDGGYSVLGCDADDGDYGYDDGGYDGGGGATPDPGDPYTWDDGTGRPECQRDENKNCITRVLTEEEWNRFAARVEEISEASEVCAGAKNALRGLVAQGRLAQRIRFWDGYDKPTPTTQRYGQNLSDTQGRYIIYDSYWVWDRAELRSLIVHEGLHLYLFQINSPLMGQENEDWVEAMGATCV